MARLGGPLGVLGTDRLAAAGARVVMAVRNTAKGTAARFKKHERGVFVAGKGA